MGAASTSCEADAVKSSCQKGCNRHCLKDDTRELRDVHEIKTVPSEMNDTQRLRAQKIVDAVLPQLLLGISVHIGQGVEAKLSITPELTALELQETSENGDRLPTCRIPLTQVVNTNSSNRCLFLHFSEAMAKEPWKLSFSNETECLSVAFTLRVLCARRA
mmetsp:Transcript_108185/g.170560  ORF Transcript_108185/g.170560 Transcript_108185/m.170560 type:complete len:161 (-) Transcript_108185:116-598(-)